MMSIPSGGGGGGLVWIEGIFLWGGKRLACDG